MVASVSSGFPIHQHLEFLDFQKITNKKFASKIEAHRYSKLASGISIKGLIDCFSDFVERLVIKIFHDHLPHPKSSHLVSIGRTVRNRQRK